MLGLLNFAQTLIELRDENLGEGIFLTFEKYKSEKFLNQICVVIRRNKKPNHYLHLIILAIYSFESILGSSNNFILTGVTLHS